jgi:hypothetical protein
MSFFGHLICADCGSDNIIGNGDNDCCGDCGSHNYVDAEDMTEEEWEQIVNPQPIKPLVELFDAWAHINGGKR